MEYSMESGAQIVIRKWVQLKPWDRLLIVTSDTNIEEAMALKKYALKRTKNVNMFFVEKKGMKVGVYFDENETIFDDYNVIIGATTYSLVTTKAAKRAIKRGSRFLSLPLSTNNGVSMLAYEFMTMDTKKTKMMSELVMKYFNHSSVIHIETEAGTNLNLYKQGRRAGFFNGVVRDGKGYSSASMEVYVPIEEMKSEGIMVLDGSLGYIGKVTEPTRLKLEGGKIVEIEQTPTGKKLETYLKHFNDEGMYVAGEFGMGLNSLSKCNGNCYIEDESAYGTFHLGFGRNIALGGIHEATAHFDLVCHEPNIYLDNRKIMHKGVFTIAQPDAY